MEACAPGRTVTIEVEAVAGKNDWLVGSLGVKPREHPFVVLLSYEDVFADPDVPPTVWVFPPKDIAPIVKSSKTGSTRFISRKHVRELFSHFLAAWNRLTQAAELSDRRGRNVL